MGALAGLVPLLMAGGTVAAEAATAKDAQASAATITADQTQKTNALLNEQQTQKVQDTYAKQQAATVARIRQQLLAQATGRSDVFTSPLGVVGAPSPTTGKKVLGG